ncbi:MULTISPECIES: ABC transporter substrate-binding protein [unclassified Microbacterium]|uniref:ABC transporter substrate-binding protein n=1 Tax=unclassified Microbacterium TaxID=2609290 RepID=UPI0030170FF3
MKHPNRRLLAGAALMAAASLMLAGCAGTSSNGPASGDPLEKVTIEVGVVPVVDVAAIYLGVQEGLFEEQGLDVNINVGASGAAVIPSVVSGQYTFGFSNMVSLLQANDQGLPIKIIAPGSASTAKEGADVTMIEVAPDSGIERARDLEGKKVTVNALNGLAQMLASIAITEDGGDPAKVTWVELPFPDELPALRSGQVDAMVGSEPFGSAAIAEGFRAISTPYLAMSDESIVTSAYYTSDAQLAANPELFTRIGAAISASLEFASDNPDAVRKIVPEFSGLSPEQAEGITLCTFRPDLPEESIDLFAKYTREYGIVKSEVTYDDLVWSEVPR